MDEILLSWKIGLSLGTFLYTAVEIPWYQTLLMQTETPLIQIGRVTALWNEIIFRKVCYYCRNVLLLSSPNKINFPTSGMQPSVLLNYWKRVTDHCTYNSFPSKVLSDGLHTNKDTLLMKCVDWSDQMDPVPCQTNHHIHKVKSPTGPSLPQQVLETVFKIELAMDSSKRHSCKKRKEK